MIWAVVIALAWVCFTVWKMRTDLVLTSDWVKEQIEIKAQKDAQDARLAKHQHERYLRMLEERPELANGIVNANKYEGDVTWQKPREETDED